MTLLDLIQTDTQSGVLTRELLEQAFEAVLRSGGRPLLRIIPASACQRCGYDTDRDGNCSFCGHTNV